MAARPAGIRCLLRLPLLGRIEALEQFGQDVRMLPRMALNVTSPLAYRLSAIFATLIPLQSFPLAKVVPMS